MIALVRRRDGCSQENSCPGTRHNGVRADGDCVVAHVRYVIGYEDRLAATPNPLEDGSWRKELVGAAGEIRGRHPVGRRKDEDVPSRIVVEPTAKLILVRRTEEDRRLVWQAVANRPRERAPGEQRLDPLVRNLHDAEERDRGKRSDQHGCSRSPRRQ